LRHLERKSDQELEGHVDQDVRVGVVHQGVREKSPYLEMIKRKLYLKTYSSLRIKYDRMKMI
jgi:DNA polymerase III psi subunit